VTAWSFDRGPWPGRNHQQACAALAEGLCPFCSAPLTITEENWARCRNHPSEYRLNDPRFGRDTIAIRDPEPGEGHDYPMYWVWFSDDDVQIR
jgi:hypothetical protein